MVNVPGVSVRGGERGRLVGAAAARPECTLPPAVGPSYGGGCCCSCDVGLVAIDFGLARAFYTRVPNLAKSTSGLARAFHTRVLN